jgi:hypothetical protein
MHQCCNRKIRIHTSSAAKQYGYLHHPASTPIRIHKLMLQQNNTKDTNTNAATKPALKCGSRVRLEVSREKETLKDWKQHK